MKVESINARVSADLKRKLEKEAKSQERSLSNLVSIILSEWFERKRK